VQTGFRLQKPVSSRKMSPQILCGNRGPWKSTLRTAFLTGIGIVRIFSVSSAHGTIGLTFAVILKVVQ